MKRACLTLLAILATIQCSFSQWTLSGTTLYTTNSVGIGTTTPGAILETSTTSAGSVLDGLILRNTGTTAGTGASITFHPGTTNAPRTRLSMFINSVGSGEFGLYTGSGNVLGLYQDYLGKIGIGTSSPDSKLQVSDGGTGSASSEILSLKTSYDADAARKALTWRDPWNITGQIDTYYDGTYTNMAFGHLYNSAYQTSDIMTIRGNGNVGIGKTTPGFPLDVNGESNAGSFRVFSTLGDNVTGAPWYGIGTSTAVIAGFSNVTQLAGYYGLNFRSAFGQMVMGAYGNVGIGTTDPQSLFQVDDGCTKASIGDASGPALNYGTSYLGFNASRTSGGWVLNTDSVTAGHNGGGVIYSGIGGDMYFAAVGSTSSSNQTLADTAIVHRIALHLAPNGIAYVKQINVQPSIFPDYVFKTDYPLMPLADVQTYINKNHHLPEIPSAEEVAKNGLNLGEINKLLVKKVEELTLYLIEKDKDLADEKAVVKKLADRVELLENKLAQK